MKSFQFGGRAATHRERAVHDRSGETVKSEEGEEAGAEKPKVGLGRIAKGHWRQVINSGLRHLAKLGAGA